jgi:hypothetical protein
VANSRKLKAGTQVKNSLNLQTRLKSLSLSLSLSLPAQSPKPAELNDLGTKTRNFFVRDNKHTIKKLLIAVAGELFKPPKCPLLTSTVSLDSRLYRAQSTSCQVLSLSLFLSTWSL